MAARGGNSNHSNYVICTITPEDLSYGFWRAAQINSLEGA